MKVLVTGGSGLVARQLLCLQQDQGYETVNLDLRDPDFSLSQCKYVKADMCDSQPEPIWHHVRMKATHNRYFATESELCSNVKRAFRRIQRQPNHVKGYMSPSL